MNYFLAFLGLAWAFFAFVDEKRAPLFALLALEDAVQLCQGIMPVWLFGILMVLIGAGICGMAYYYNVRKVEDTFGAIMYALIGVFGCAMGVMAF